MQIRRFGLFLSFNPDPNYLKTFCSVYSSLCNEWQMFVYYADLPRILLSLLFYAKLSIAEYRKT